MARNLGIGLLLMITVVSIQVQSKRSPNIDSVCLGNMLRLSIGPLKGKALEVDAKNASHILALTPNLASKCGFSVKMDSMGNAMVFASLQNCFVQNSDDETFTTVTYLRLKGNNITNDETYAVEKTCTYTPWAFREILCDRNYMEVSVRRTVLDNPLPEQSNAKSYTNLGRFRRAANPKTATASGYSVTTVVFTIPEQRVMKIDQVQRTGYGITNTPTRLVLRSPLNAPEMFFQNVAGVPMAVLKTSTILENTLLSTQIDSSVACPTPGSVSFTPNMITWSVPQRIDPLVSSCNFQLKEVFLGVEGMRLSPGEVMARRYSLSLNKMHIILQIPVGAVGGYFKSHVKNGQYLTTYSIEPMLEILWTEDDPPKDTRYKVLFPITTPFIISPLQLVDRIVPEEGVFKVELGTFLQDVELINITFLDGVLSVAECNDRGFNIEELSFPNGSKSIALTVPFTDRAVLNKMDARNVIYTLHMVFGLVVLPEYSSFTYTAVTEVSVKGIVPAYITGTCDHENFHVTVKSGNQVQNLRIVVGQRLLTPEIAEQYRIVTEGAHIFITVPFYAPDTVFEVIESLSIRSKLHVSLRDPVTMNIQHFSLSCSFLSALTECFANGTIAAVAAKIESVPSMIPSQLTLKDPACGPAYSDDRIARFLFTGRSCGTTRKFISSVMLYENEISLPSKPVAANGVQMEEPQYMLKVFCYYMVNATHSAAFLTNPRNNDPHVHTTRSQLRVIMRLAQDISYNLFQEMEEFPLVLNLREPLYFEVEVEVPMNSDPRVVLKLEYCWATLKEDRKSQPRWNLIINGCENTEDPFQVVFHPVSADARVQYPSHFKRFEVQMFSFMDEDNPSYLVYVHCDVVICDDKFPSDGLCSEQCVNKKTKGQRRAFSEGDSTEHVTSGPILMFK
ncbi:uncharacterized protein LOC134025304 [Osmerus eperlanus]|uniref:uncharacterized protein LOC134025304 n=1 Tax=Osmerus eperlanus TaxID=29151 RepID=UPI002E130692